MAGMSKLGDFIKSGFGMWGDKKSLDRPLTDDELNDVRFDEILRAMEKIDPLDKAARATADIHVENFMHKMKLTTKSEDVLKLAEDRATFYSINLFDRKLRQNQIDDLKNLTREFDKVPRKPGPSGPG